MIVKLHSGLRKVAFIAICLAALTAYVNAVLRHYVAFRSATRLDVRSLERAIEFEPGNADARWRLGRYSLYLSQNSTAAVAILETAVALNPHLAQYWLDLASAYEVAGDAQRQREALEKALQAEPTTPEVTWNVANYYLVENDATRALPLLRTVIENDATRLNAALQLCWHATRDVHKILDEALPQNSTAYLAFLDLLIKRDEASQAAEVWSRLVSLKESFAVAGVFPYIDYLLQKRSIDSATQVWVASVHRNGELTSYIDDTNLVFNGDLEKEFLNGGFDWRYELRDAVQLSIDTRDFDKGNQSLRFDFRGPAIADTGFFQYVPVRPNTAYCFSAYTKAQDIESASGPRIMILDAYTGSQYVSTDDSLGTTGWRQQSAEFRTTQDSSLLMIKVARVPGDVLIKGTFWIDNITLIQR